VTSISEVVYQLSAKAVGALNNPDSALPPDLRALLSMVDGVSPVAQYQPFLKALEPIGKPGATWLLAAYWACLRQSSC
jgi:hypothetical protein